MTFRDFARDCCDQLDRWGYSKLTRHLYDRRYMQFLAFIKSKGAKDDLRSFNDELVRTFADYLRDQKLHPNTVISTLSSLRTLAKYGMMCRDERDRRLISEDPTASFRWPTFQQQETKYVHPTELRDLLDQRAPTHQALARDLFVETGIRAGEAASLNVEDLHEVNGRYFLSVKRKGRGQQARVEKRDIPLSRALGDALRDWLLARGHVEDKHREFPLLVRGDGQRWSSRSISGMIARLAARAGIDRLRVSSHKLRHTANVVARRAGLDPAVRARRFGHSSLRSQERYDHVLPEELHEATETYLGELQSYIGGPVPAEPNSGPVTESEQAPSAADDAGPR